MTEITILEHGQVKKLKDGRYVITIKHDGATIKYTLSKRASDEIDNAENEIQKSMLESIAKSLAQLIDIHDDLLRSWKPHKALEELNYVCIYIAKKKERLQNEWYTEFTNYS